MLSESFEDTDRVLEEHSLGQFSVLDPFPLSVSMKMSFVLIRTVEYFSETEHTKREHFSLSCFVSDSSQENLLFDEIIVLWSSRLNESIEKVPSDNSEIPDAYLRRVSPTSVLIPG